MSFRSRSISVLGLALVGLVGVLADARPALALGCHLPDRPVLGLSPADTLSNHDAGLFLFNANNRPDWPRDAGVTQVAPRPCESESPGSPERVVASAPAVLATPYTIEPDPRSMPVVALAPLAHPVRLASRLERPPRPSDRSIPITQTADRLAWASTLQ